MKRFAGISATLQSMILHQLLVSVAAWTVGTHAIDLTFGIDVPPRKVECYYFELDATQLDEVTIEFAVVEGGNLDINAYVRGPNGNVIERETMTSEGVFTVQPEAKPTGSKVEDWAYSLCIDNSFSKVTGKRVDIDMWGNGDEYYDKKGKGDELDQKIDKAFEEMQDVAADMRQQFREIFRNQAYLRHRSIRHEMTAEAVKSRVEWWSAFFTIFIILVPIGQVMYVRKILSNAGDMRGMGGTPKSSRRNLGSGISF